MEFKTMKKETVSGFKGGRVKLVTKENFFYYGEITDVDDDVILFEDTKGQELVIALDFVGVIQRLK